MPFSKSGGTASSEARYVAKVIAARSMGREIEWESPHTVCYSVVNTEPREAIMVDAHYAYDGQNFAFDQVKMINDRSDAQYLATLAWARAHYHEKFM